MSTVQEQNKSNFRRTYDELFNRGSLGVADELVTEDFINYEVPPGRNNRGPDSLRQVAQMLRQAFPDLHFEIEELVAEGDSVVGRLVMRGTHQGVLMGIAPTGRRVEQAQVHFVR